MSDWNSIYPSFYEELEKIAAAQGPIPQSTADFYKQKFDEDLSSGKVSPGSRLMGKETAKQFLLNTAAIGLGSGIGSVLGTLGGRAFDKLQKKRNIKAHPAFRKYAPLIGAGLGAVAGGSALLARHLANQEMEKAYQKDEAARLERLQQESE